LLAQRQQLPIIFRVLHSELEPRLQLQFIAFVQLLVELMLKYSKELPPMWQLAKVLALPLVLVQEQEQVQSILTFHPKP
jgi:hypothetical protein